MYQQAAWQVSLFLIIILMAIFVFVVMNSGHKKDYGQVKKKAYRIRNWAFIIVIGLMVAGTILTIKDIPFERPVYGSEKPVIVDAVAKQFAFELSQTEFEVGQPIEFLVTSADVNHGFGIYDEDMNIIAQTQAMPEYTNTIYYTFKKPGTYQILCMEYCGVAHHVMIGSFEVVAAQD
jgi:cytochrome c oxidase subunit II